MKSLSVLGLAVGLCALIAVQGEAAAQTCQSACGLEKKACLVGPRANLTACRLACRTNATAAELGECLHGCAQTFRSEKEQCRGGVADCVGACAAADSLAASESSACLGGCGQDLGSCARDVVTLARQCIRDCRSASDRGGCLEICGGTARDGADACAATFSTCRASCGVLPPVPTCGHAEAPTCDGSCPLPSLSCVAVSANRCGCIPGSPGGASVD